MATILLSAAGAAIGGTVGGSVLGLSVAAIGRFAGAVIGRTIDQRLLGQGSDTVESGKVSRLRLTGAGEGDAISQIYGRTRIAGQVIWATDFRENVTVTEGSSGGKGTPSPPTPTTVEYRYSVSLALGLCEGEISHIGRIWADGVEISTRSLNMRAYPGDFEQLPDPKISAVEGASTVPAYRGTAYVVIEDLDLTPYGNRVPQFTFEVSRPTPESVPTESPDLTYTMKGVALLPGSGEYALATSRANINFGFGSTKPANVNSRTGLPDFLVSLDHMNGELPALQSTSLIVSWFGNDLRCDRCTIRPKVEQKTFDSGNLPWQVSGLSRSAAQLVTRDETGREYFGGTPTDQSVVQAIQALKFAGKDVMYYPFILMDQGPGNSLTDPYTGSGGQSVFPWRGRITTSLAPGIGNSPDGTAGAAAEVAAFFGTAQASHFTFQVWPPFTGGVSSTPDPALNDFRSLIEHSGILVQSPVQYSGPNQWGYRRFILHQAALCAAAGGVESFCIGSEMRGLTQIRGANNSFPAVEQLIDLAADVRSILGPDVKIGYAADWSEYFGYQPNDGSGDRFFHLDALWADSNINFIGIDNYMPLSDWRNGRDHLDAQAGYRSIYDMDYLKANIEGGEGYDWFYASAEDRDAQVRTPITDGAYDEPWVFRYKDMRNWWENEHYDRVGGVRSSQTTAWQPRSKPFRFTEYGCAAIDKGTNQPNKFLDPKSSESAIPFYSEGLRDELIQYQYLRSTIEYWSDAANNPVSPVYGDAMIDMDHACAWAWDMRPYPYFPSNDKLWSDADNYSRGHWLNGRMSSRPLASVVAEICDRAGVLEIDTTRLYGMVRGYTVDQVSEARSALQPLSLRYGFDAVERDGVLHFITRDGVADYELEFDQLVRDPELDGLIEYIRGSEVDLSGKVRLRFIEADGDFEVAAVEATLPGDNETAVSSSEIPLAMTRSEARQTVERWLAESRTATDTLRFTLPPSLFDLRAGHTISLPEPGGKGLYRIDRIDQASGLQKVEAVRIEPENYRPALFEEDRSSTRSYEAPGPVTPFFLDLPLLSSETVPHAPYIAVNAEPWPGAAALYSSDENSNYELNQIIAARTPVGELQSPLTTAPSGLTDTGAPLRVKMVSGELQSVSDLAFLNGANLCAIGDGTSNGWEVVQFRDAELIDANTYLLRNLLRGQGGSEVEATWPEGSFIVLLDNSVRQITLAEAKRGLSRFYRIGPASLPLTDPTYSVAQLAFDGIGLRPLSPVHLRLSGAPGQDRELSWIRRSRIDADRWEIPEIPLGEETESYVIRVIQGNSVIREEISTSPSWIYSAALQAEDAIIGAYRIEIAQLSARFGPGRPAVLDIAA
ncbi:MAG: glycoside hydrolase TIM-barrel-like domain-containing protein [Pseudomonadota bacterium]